MKTIQKIGLFILCCWLSNIAAIGQITAPKIPQTKVDATTTKATTLTPKPKEKKTPQKAAASVLKIATDADCYLSVDGESKGLLKVGSVIRVIVNSGSTYVIYAQSTMCSDCKIIENLKVSESNMENVYNIDLRNLVDNYIEKKRKEKEKKDCIANCKDCSGSGQKEVKKRVSDPECNGSGDVNCLYCKGTGLCGVCHGSGEGYGVCSRCRGTGDCVLCHGNKKVRCTNCNGTRYVIEKSYVKCEHPDCN